MYCTLHAIVQQHVGRSLDTNINESPCISADSHKLQQHCLCALEFRTHTKCCILVRKYDASPRKSNDNKVFYTTCTNNVDKHNNHLKHPVDIIFFTYRSMNLSSVHIDNRACHEFLKHVVNTPVNHTDMIFLTYRMNLISKHIDKHAYQELLEHVIKTLKYSEDNTLFTHRKLNLLRTYKHACQVFLKTRISTFELNVHIIFLTHRRMKLLRTHIDSHACLNPSKHIVGTYSKSYEKYFFPITYIQGGPQLNLWNGYKVKVLRSKGLNISIQKIRNLLDKLIWNRMSTSSNVAATTRKLFEQNVDNIDTLSNGQKRQVNAMVVSSQKKTKGKGLKFQRPPFWLGYHTLNTIACENGGSLEPTLSVSELVKRGMKHEEALEHLVAIPSFPYVPQEAWPSKREDGKEGGHFNLTQVPFDIKIDEGGLLWIIK